MIRDLFIVVGVVGTLAAAIAAIDWLYRRHGWSTARPVHELSVALGMNPDDPS